MVVVADPITKQAASAVGDTTAVEAAAAGRGQLAAELAGQAITAAAAEVEAVTQLRVALAGRVFAAELAAPALLLRRRQRPGRNPLVGAVALKLATVETVERVSYV